MEHVAVPMGVKKTNHLSTSRGRVNRPEPKDAWDKIATLTPSFVTLVLGLLGAYATYSYNERNLEERRQEPALVREQQTEQSKRELLQRQQQAHDAQVLAETQQLEKLFTHISSPQVQSREFGYAMFAALGKEELALRIINFNKDKAGISLAQHLIGSTDHSVRSAASESLATLRAIPDRYTINTSDAVAEHVRTYLGSRLSYFVGCLARIGLQVPSTRKI